MSLFSKLTKNNDKSIYPWSQRKLGGGNSAFPRFGHATAALPSDQLVLYGGMQPNGPAKKDLYLVDANNVSISSFNASGDVPPPRCFPTLVSIRNFALLYGGEPVLADDKWDPHVYILNIANKQWNRIRMEGHLPVERSRHSASIADGIMYVWGGQRAGRYLNDMIAFNTTTYPSNSHWEFIKPNNEGPSARAGHVSVVFDNKLYIFGGTDGDHLYNDVWAFDLQSRLWMQVPAVGYIPIPRTDFSASLVDGVMYIFGGRGPDGQDLGDLCAFRIKSQRWYMFQNMGPAPSARYGLSISSVKERLYVLGGDNGNGKLEDGSMAYILDCSKIRYPPETAAQQPPAPQPHPSQPQPQQQHYPSTQSQQSNASPSSTSFQSMSESEASIQRGGGPPPPPLVQNSQSTPIRSPPPMHQSIPPSPSQQQQQPTQYNGTANGSINGSPAMHELEPPQLIEPQPSMSAPMPAGGGDHVTPQSKPQDTPQPSKPRHASVVPEAARRRTRTTSPMPFTEVDTNMEIRHHGPMSPASISSNENDKGGSLRSFTDDERPTRPTIPRNTMNGIAPPPRPSREGVNLNSSYRHTMADHVIDDRPKSQMPRSTDTPPRVASPMANGRHHQHDTQDTSSMDRTASPIPRQQEHSSIPNGIDNNGAPLTPPPRPKSSAPVPDPIQEEKAALVRELRSRELIVNEMRKKEQWWRTEVSIARKLRAAQGERFDDDVDEERLLMDFDGEPDKFKLFDQLVHVKAELRRVKQSIMHQAQPMSQKVTQADRMRVAALQEAAYFKAKYESLKSRQPLDPTLEADRVEELEKRLAAALSENEANSRLLQQLQQRAQHDHSSRLAAEERAKDAHERAQEAQEAHQRALEELANVHDRAIQAEAQTRQGTVKIAELTQQLANALATTQDVSEAHISVSRLEAANLKARNEVAALKQKLAESMDDMARLRTILSERDETLKETTRELEDAEIQLAMMRDAMHRIENSAPSPPRGF
ncbi:related to kel1-involved in cell fusion andmorphology [Lichtheimia corymbifera JMRC:FSU:9682]|uniref:Related to kel1-involved in cell fusion andmorphology n=1 Tax=Lichtheimia corymbifera JMRC:FSU:9682 TaxID=1263082 RepID=A0A068S3N6_9FUNG|nr:related to kel1-involved in cell fusion andmorphology [Lichtheimia corymbifera JMRC:FSU:9682]